MRVTEQADEGFGEIVAVGERPERRAVAMHNHGLAVQHALRDDVAASAADAERENFVVGVRRPDDHHREAFFTIGAGQTFFAQDFLLRIRPEGIEGGRRFGQDVGGGGLLVDRGRADEDILIAFAAKQIDVALDLVRVEGDPVDHHVEMLVAERRRHLIGLVDVGGERGRALDGDGLASTIEQIQVDAVFDGEFADGNADVAGAADE